MQVPVRQRELTVVTGLLLETGETPGTERAPAALGYGHRPLDVNTNLRIYSWADAFRECSAFESECASFEFVPHLYNFFSGTFQEKKKKKRV